MLRVDKVGNSAYHDHQRSYQHVLDPNERRRLALAEVDRAPFSWYHIRLVVVTGVGFFTDAYSLFAINLTTILMGMAFWQESNNGVMPHNVDTAIKVATAGGTVIGQLVFGYLADLLGRKRMYGVELLLIITATLAQSLTAPSRAMSFVGVIVFYRVIMGVGVGGDYPMSAVITAELSPTRWRGSLIAAVFAMQGIGQFAAALMALILAVSWRGSLESVKSVGQCDDRCMLAVDSMWRIMIAFGGIPGWFALYYRLTIPETPRYTFDVLQDVDKAAADVGVYATGKKGEAKLDTLKHAQHRAEMARYRIGRPSLAEVFRYFTRGRNFLHLFGTAGSWFFLDIAFYGLGLNTPTIMSAIGFAGHSNIYQTLLNTAVGQLVLICAGAIPGYWMTVFLVDILGRRPIQIAGFTILTIIFAVIGFAFHSLNAKALLALYIMSQFFFNFGPNATTFITPAEIFPTRVRSTGHGISAAAGKVGAILAQVVFAPMVKKGATPDNPNAWLHGVMKIFALFMACGILTSFLVPETKRKTLEGLTGEKEGDHVYELKFVSGFPVSLGRRTSTVGIKMKNGLFGWVNKSKKYFRLSWPPSTLGRKNSGGTVTSVQELRGTKAFEGVSGPHSARYESRQTGRRDQGVNPDWGDGPDVFGHPPSVQWNSAFQAGGQGTGGFHAR